MDDVTQPPETAASSRRQELAALPSLIKLSVPYAVVGLFILALGATLFFASELFIPIFFAVFLSTILRPFVRTLKRLRVPELAGGLIVLVVMLSVIGAAVLLLSQPASRWIEQIPEVVNELEVKLWSLRQTIEEAKQATDDLGDVSGEAGAPEVVVRGPSLLERIANYTWLTFAQAFITLALLYLLLAQGPSASQRFTQMFEVPRYRAVCVDFLETVQGRFSTYVRTLTLINLGVGIATTAALWLIGMPNPVMWGVLAFFLGFLPYLGPFLMITALALAGLITFDNWYAILAPPAAFTAINIVESYGVTPHILGRKLTLNPLVVFLSMLFWTWAWGMPGTLLSVPIAVLIKLVYEHAALLHSERLRASKSASPPVVACSE